MISKFKLAAMAAAATFAATAANAAVTVTFSSFQEALNAGEYLVSDFDSGLAPGWSLVGGAIVNGDNPAPDGTAAPSFGPVDPADKDPTDYLAVYGGTMATLTGNAGSISFYIGSLDRGNKVTIKTTSGNFVYTGGDLAAFSGAANGMRHSPMTNGRFTFTSDDAITGVELFSTNDSLEISNIGATAVPEPATWAMMIIGFGAVGSMARSARRRGAFAVA